MKSYKVIAGSGTFTIIADSITSAVAMVTPWAVCIRIERLMPRSAS